MTGITPPSPRPTPPVGGEVFDVASSVLGNTREVCRQSYVHPASPDAFRSGRLGELWARSRSTAQLDRIERTVQRVLDD